MIYTKQLFVIIFTLLLAANATSATFFFDSFESGDMSATNEDGFKWYNTGKTSVVTAEAEVYNQGKIHEPVPAGEDWTPKYGNHSLMFRYPVGEPWIEQRFSIGKAYPEIWMSFWLRVPTNYTHPEFDGAADNQKLFRLWMDKYGADRDGGKVGLSFRGDGTGGSYLFAKIGGSRDLGRVPFISVPGDRGKWMHLVVHVASETIPGARDGLMRVWRRWEADSGYTMTHDLKDQPINLGSSVKGFAKGYLMGWHNATYPVETNFLIDNFALATSPLFTDSGAPHAPDYVSVE